MAKVGFPVLLGWQRQAFQFYWDSKGRLSKLFFFPLTCWWASMVADWESAESLLSAETESPQGSEVTSFRDWESTGIRDSLFQRLRVHRGQRFPLSETESPQRSEVPSFRDWESTGIRGSLFQRLRVHRDQRFPLSETESPQGSEVVSLKPGMGHNLGLHVLPSGRKLACLSWAFSASSCPGPLPLLYT